MHAPAQGTNACVVSPDVKKALAHLFSFPGGALERLHRAIHCFAGTPKLQSLLPFARIEARSLCDKFFPTFDESHPTSLAVNLGTPV